MCQAPKRKSAGPPAIPDSGPVEPDAGPDTKSGVDQVDWHSKMPVDGLKWITIYDSQT